MSIEQLLLSPNEHDFYQAVFQIQRQLSDDKASFHGVGHDSLPNQELIRFKADQHLGFPGQSISKVAIKDKQLSHGTAVDMSVSFMGLTGPSGALPQHYSEMVLARLKLKDTGMKDFYDLFNHRLISLFYRAWEKYRYSASYQLGSDTNIDSFSSVLQYFSGQSSLAKYYAGFHHRASPSAESLATMLREFTQGQVEVAQFQGRWQRLKPEEQTQLGGRCRPEGQYACLGVDASLGKQVWDINSAIKITLSFKSSELAAEFLPGKQKTKWVKALISDYLGKATQFKLQLNATTAQMPTAQLSANGLGLGSGCSLVSRPCQSQKVQTISI
ncbi:type VI secretion system baseplate subunit TssG [Shewanella waksmanii]|uniref:type VI secretion system baseplate subunit TssG n=1 Tax=Shewanella waksmanii TaxID=213783 RepID=UPI0037369D68